MITLAIADGTTMQAYVAYPAGTAPCAALLVFQEAFGVNHYMKDIGDRMAAEGYLAIVPELFHRTAEPGFEIGYTDFAKVMPHLQALTPEGMTQDAVACYNWLLAQERVVKDKVGCIGFCMGGRVSFLVNSELPLAAAVSFYGGGMHMLADRADRQNGPLLMFWGGQDKHIKPENIQTIVDALKRANKPFVNVELSYADHGFFCNERSAYHAEASAEAWGMVKAFLVNKLKL